MALPFYKRLVLNKWALNLFGYTKLEDFADYLKDDSLEGFDEDNISKFAQVIGLHLTPTSSISREQILAYDENIVRHWKSIADPRCKGGKLITPKYFQYLSLLFTEIYLDKFFRDKSALLSELNLFLSNENKGLSKGDKLEPFNMKELNKLAFWNATGSGKTLLMHINILQYRHYLSKNGRSRELNRVILLTPNEGLSLQHLDEFKMSKLSAQLFRKDYSASSHLGIIEIIDIHKLKDESGDKTVAVEAFEGNNLVLVDEGHKGTGGNDWMEKRNKLCEEGFSFEYSATFGQALKAANKKDQTQQYAKCILFDYSYRYFYQDGYGKDYKILNMSEDSDEERMHTYLTACLLTFYQQIRLFEEGGKELRPFNIHRPLWVFVGAKVNAVRSERGKKVSDVTAILSFLGEFTKDRQKSIQCLDRIFKGQDGLTDDQGRSLFAAAFGHIHRAGLSAEEVYTDILEKLFHSRVSGRIHVEHLKGGDGEIALRLGEGNQPFGVINVGDAKTLWNLCDEVDELVTIEKDFSESLFRKINDENGGINLLIGSKKFSEGWNSWRVSTMGLMNLGKKEGSEIIQLFGRGVRLKGYDFCLKRSSELRGIKKPDFILPCETLNIFGVRADYMQQFKEYLEEEGLPTEKVEISLPVINNLGKVKLKVPAISSDVNFKKQDRTSLDVPPESFITRPLTLDWYPKIQAIIAEGLSGGLADSEKHEVRLLTDKQLAFINWDEVYFELVRHKNERSWYNFDLSKDVLSDLLRTGGWFRLKIPAQDIAPTSFSNIKRCQEVVTALLKKYCDRFYNHKRDEFEKPHIGYKELTPDDPNFFEEYNVAIDKSAQAIIDEVIAISTAIENDELKEIEYATMHSILFQKHLYHPLLHIKGKTDQVTVSPVDLNEGEKDFVLDLRKFYEESSEWFEGRELYLLRNLSRGRGVGFFQSENFHPDFIIWVVQGEKQFIAFADPKGIRNLHGLDDPKIMFHEKVKELENRLGDDNVSMSAFIISNTPLEAVKWWSGGDAVEFNKRNVLFQNEDKDIYIRSMLERTVSAAD
ncbi:DEAD/DEAH box helicase family protein [Maridesulfovibrio sp.]|uniref:DEAD/DEAH box helicase family protein n=1 Tax=Maridesulfovibrio sp. TaxID=2795000 RepID=UPI0039EE488A